MPLTKGQAHALHMLLHTRSQFRLHLEGKYTMNAGQYVYKENLPPAHKALDADTLVATLIAQAAILQIPGAQFDQPTKDKLKLLFDPTGVDMNGVQTNLATNKLTIRHALAMDQPYPDNTPCPPIPEQNTIAAAIIASMPGPL